MTSIAWPRAPRGDVSPASRGDLSPALDPADPVPLYHQIVQAIRWRIGTGALRPGDRLPPLRTAAKEWGVHLHTVRRAYGILAEAGLVESRPGAGTTVAGGDRSGAGESPARAPTRPRESVGPGDLERWLEGVLAEARGRYGLTSDGLAARIGERGRRAPRATLVECNDHQCRDLADQIATRWGVRIAPWSLERAGPPPAGTLIGTRFHAPEMRRRWPERRSDMRFVRLVLDPAVEEATRMRARETDARGLTLCERDAATGRQMASDLAGRLEVPRPIRVTTVAPDDALHALGPDDLLLVAPRCWDLLRPDARRDPRVLEVRHVIDPHDLEALGELL